MTAAVSFYTADTLRRVFGPPILDRDSSDNGLVFSCRNSIPQTVNDLNYEPYFVPKKTLDTSEV